MAKIQFYNEFKIVDVEKSLAGIQRFTDQIGLITAAFYYPKAGTRKVGTGLGEAKKTELKTSEFEAGRLRAVVHIHYVDADELEAQNRK